MSRNLVTARPISAYPVVVFVVNKQGIVDSHSAFTAGVDLESPMILLVDSKTASAAEVVTAALQ